MRVLNEARWGRVRGQRVRPQRRVVRLGPPRRRLRGRCEALLREEALDSRTPTRYRPSPTTNTRRDKPREASCRFALGVPRRETWRDDRRYCRNGARAQQPQRYVRLPVESWKRDQTLPATGKARPKWRRVQEPSRTRRTFGIAD